MEKALHLGASARIAQHAPGLTLNLLPGVQRALRSNSSQILIRERVPQAVREPCRSLIVIRFGVTESNIQKARRFQGQQHDALDGVFYAGIFLIFGWRGLSLNLSLLQLSGYENSPPFFG